jgi:hypothetical protein
MSRKIYNPHKKFESSKLSTASIFLLQQKMNALFFTALDIPCSEPSYSTPGLPHHPQRRVLFPKRSMIDGDEKHLTRINKRPRTGLPMMPVTIDTCENTIPDDLPPKIHLSRRSTKTDILVLPSWQASEMRRRANEMPEIPDLSDDVSEALRLITHKKNGSSAFSSFSGRRSSIRPDSNTYLSKAA